MSLLSNLTTDASIEEERDSVGGGGALESGLYNATVTLAYVQPAASGAIGIVLHFKTEDDKVIRSTQYVTSGTAKGGKNTYERDGKTYYLPGFLIVNSLAQLTVGKELPQLDTEEKVVNVYNTEAKAEVPTKVPMLMDLIGKEITIGLLKQVVDRTAKSDDGKYLPTGETREENEIDKFFQAESKLTNAEIKANATEPTFIHTWDKKWTGVTRDRSTKTGGTAGAPKGAAGAKKPATSLFS
jgi:hypothetical protein